MPIPSNTVALPIVKGLDLTTDERLLSPPALLEATNSRFTGGAAHKRRGHTNLRVKSAGTFGDQTLTRPSGQEDIDLWHSTYTYSGDLLGTFVRDSETVAWDGVDLYSYMPSQATSVDPTFTRINASMPSLHAVPAAKFNEHQVAPEMADNGTTRIVAWINEHSQARYAIYDSTSGVLISSGTLAVTTARYLRVITLSNWMHIVVYDSDINLVRLFTINSLNPTTVTYQSAGPAADFDLWKHSDSLMLLARSNPDGIYLNWYQADGNGSSTRTSQVLNSPGAYAPGQAKAFGAVAACAHPTNGEICVIWSDSVNSYIAGSVLTDAGEIFPQVLKLTTAQRITVAPRTSLMTNGHGIWDCFWDDGTNLYRQRFWFFGNGTTHTRYGLTLASRGFNAGDRTFLWAGYTSLLGVQSTWFLLDETLLPVGRCDFAVANINLIAGRVAGINWTTQSAPHLALNYKQRVESTSADVTDGIYTEPSIKTIYLDFYPRLHTAQAGRSTYIAGAQLWSYDGKELLEEGFHLGPEVTIGGDSGGALTALGTYSYRVDLCHKNDQNEEVRSLSILTESFTLAGGQQTIGLNFKCILTRRTDSYFLVYRNAMSSGVPLTNWWLLNSRDPSDPSYLANDLAMATYNVVDNGTISDTIIQTRELHPAGDTYLQPVSAPACEVVAAGRDRLWVAGGELLPGQIVPSRLFEPGECPTFNPYLAFQVDRSNEPVTAIGFIGEIGVAFRANSTYLIDSDGPDNNASGSWNPPRLALTDIGAVSQSSVARVVQGLIFQSPAGFRVLGPGGALSPIGQPIDSVAKDLTIIGTLVIEPDQEVRFYTESETYVYNYLYDTWAKWTVGGVGVAKNTTGLALVAQSDGNLWVETDGTWNDAGRTYNHRIRTAWLHGGNVGEFQRLRRVGGVGRYADLSNPNHNLRLEFYYDTREFWEDRHEWSFPDTTTNEDTWGAGTWGTGVWGDTSATISNLEDLTWDWQKDPAIQKCNSVSIALQDYNTDGPGFVLSAFTLELARKPGLDRGPTRTGTGSYRT